VIWQVHRGASLRLMYSHTHSHNERIRAAGCLSSRANDENEDPKLDPDPSADQLELIKFTAVGRVLHNSWEIESADWASPSNTRRKFTHPPYLPLPPAKSYASRTLTSLELGPSRSGQQKS
jgi:hypothetical protein